MRRILFLPIHTPSLLEMLPIAQKLAEDGRYEPVFFIFRPIAGVHLADLRAQGMRVIGPQAGAAPAQQAVKAESANMRGETAAPAGSPLKKLLQWALSTTLLSFIWYFFAFGRQQWTARRLLKREKVAAVIVMGDRHVGWETAFIRMANQRGIPSLIVPYALSDPLPDYRSRLRFEHAAQYRVKSKFDRFLARRFPTWAADGEAGALFFVPAGVGLAAKVWGMMPAQPWVLGGGAATCMAVENPRMQQQFQAFGVPPDKMRVTGKPSVDQIYKTMQAVDTQTLRQTWGVAEGQLVLLCAVPQLAEHGLLPWDEHWQEIEFLISTLAAQAGVLVVLSLHPKSNPDDYRLFAERYGAVLATRRIYELLPACDIFVATFSSTVMQAIGLAKPAIVVDFYGLNYTFYDADAGVQVLHQHDKLAPLLEKIVTSRAYYDQLADLQQRSSAAWALLDGQCTPRIMACIYQLVED